MTKSMDRNIVMDAWTWEPLSERATERLIAECAASSDGTAIAHFVNDDDGHYWDYGHTAGYLNRSEVRIGLPMLTESSTVADLERLLAERGFKIALGAFDGFSQATAIRDGRSASATANKAYAAINEAIFLLERRS